MDKFPNRLMSPTKTKAKASDYISEDLMPLLESILTGLYDSHIMNSHKLHKDVYTTKIQQICTSGVFSVVPYRLKARIRAQHVRRWGVLTGALSDLFYNSSGNSYSYIKPQVRTKFFDQTPLTTRTGQNKKGQA